MASPRAVPAWPRICLAVLLLWTTLVAPIHAQVTDGYVEATDANGVRRQLLDTRKPALYTGDFGDCMGGQSLLNVTLFDAAYYADNMTVLFHVGGATSLQEENIMMYISVDAYGENRFNLVFNPCDANFASLCPMQAGVPISGVAVIPVSKADVAGIPSIALSIPDFEGSASLRIFSNATQSEIGCYRAVMRNGATFSQPAAVGSVLGIFALAAVIASTATAVYGTGFSDVRNHYAHSLSALIVFEVFHYIFFSGALSLLWPSVLPAFWSNFAWSAGQIYTSSMVHSINKFTGVSGNSTSVGSAGSTVINSGGGLQQQIYGRGLGRLGFYGNTAMDIFPRQQAGAPPDPPRAHYGWAGGVEHPGLPLPGNWSAYGGTLSDVHIPAADSFLVGFIWFLILVLILLASIVFFKLVLEVLDSFHRLKEGRLSMFRNYWLSYAKLLVLRSMLIAFFMMMTLTLFQFSYGGRAGPIAIAVIVFLIFFVGMFASAFYAFYSQNTSAVGKGKMERKKVLGFIPWFNFTHVETSNSTDSSLPESHQPEADYLHKHGWLSARYRRTRWWYFAIWLVYQFVRACFVGGARASPVAQVAGLLIVDIIAFAVIVKLRPHEGMRNTAIAAFLLGLSKILTSGLCIAFLPSVKLARIPATIVGVVIIVIQGLLVVALLILIVLSVFSSYMSLTRNREHFTPQKWQGLRQKYLTHIQEKATDLPPPPKPATPPPEEPKEPYFALNNVRRVSKIEDEDKDPGLEVDDVPPISPVDPPSGRNSRSNSMRSSAVPYGARVHRASWSSRDFAALYDVDERSASPLNAPPLNAPPRTASGQSMRRASRSGMTPSPLPAGRIVTTLPGSNSRPGTPGTPTTPTRQTLENHAAERFGISRPNSVTQTGSGDGKIVE